MVPLFGAAYVNGIIQGLFMGFEHFLSPFHDKFSFQGLFKTALYIQVPFKPVQALVLITLSSYKDSPEPSLLP